MVGRRASSPSPTPTDGRVDLPHLVLDPVWSLRQWPVVVEVAGEELAIPAMCAADWLQVLMDPQLQPDDVFPGLLEAADRSHVEDQLHSGLLELRDSQELAMEIISTVSGRPWWVSLRLIWTAVSSWDALGGDMVTKANAATLSLAAWLDVLFLHIVQNIDDDKRTMFLLKLEIIPEGWGPPAEEQMEMSQDAFLAMAG